MNDKISEFFAQYEERGKGLWRRRCAKRPDIKQNRNRIENSDCKEIISIDILQYI